MRKAHLYLLMLMATVGLVSNAEAKNRDKSWEFSGLIGNVDGDRDARVANGTSFTLRAGYNVTAKIEAEFSFSNERAEQGNFLDDPALVDQARRQSHLRPCPTNVSASDPPCYMGFAGVDAKPDRDDLFRRYVAAITGNFLTDRDTRTLPYITAGIGFIQETRDPYPFSVELIESIDQDMDPSTPRQNVHFIKKSEVLQRFDSSALLTIGVGARTFFADNFAVRYEARYNHHDSFQTGQNEYVVDLGVSWIVGGQK